MARLFPCQGASRSSLKKGIEPVLCLTLAAVYKKVANVLPLVRPDFLAFVGVCRGADIGWHGFQVLPYFSVNLGVADQVDSHLFLIISLFEA